jgi:hypothetical protein
MRKSRLDRFLAPWVFVLTGVVFNILAAVITHYFIGLNNDQHSDSPAIIDNYYREYLDDLVNAHGLKEFNSPEQRTMTNDIELMLAISSAAQKSIIESINATYFETLELQEAKMPLEQDNSRLFSIAIFLQVIGLILVLARDLRRH